MLLGADYEQAGSIIIGGEDTGLNAELPQGCWIRQHSLAGSITLGTNRSNDVKDARSSTSTLGWDGPRGVRMEAGQDQQTYQEHDALLGSSGKPIQNLPIC